MFIPDPSSRGAKPVRECTTHKLGRVADLGEDLALAKGWKGKRIG